MKIRPLPDRVQISGPKKGPPLLNSDPVPKSCQIVHATPLIAAKLTGFANSGKINQFFQSS